MMTKLPITKARDEFAEAVNRVAYRGERIVLERRGRAVAALVPAEDVQLLEQIEDRLDIDEARKALAQPGKSVAWKTVKKRLGL